MLTMRKLLVLIEGLPPTARIASIQRDGPYWPLEAYLLDDIRMVLTGSKKKPAKPHPARPQPKREETPERASKRQAALRRARARRRAIERGELT